VTYPGAVVYFITRDVDAVVRAARVAGVMPTFGPEDRPWGNREAYFQDRDGNTHGSVRSGRCSVDNSGPRRLTRLGD